MFIVKPGAQNSFDLDRFIYLLKEKRVDFLVTPDARAITFLLDPSEFRVSGGFAIIHVIDLDQLARILRLFSLSQDFEVTLLNDEDQIEVVIIPVTRRIESDDIVGKRLPLGESASELSIGLDGALLPPDPWNTRPTSPTEKTAIWANRILAVNPEIRGERNYHMAIRNIYIWSKRKENLFSDIGPSSALYWRHEADTDVWGILFQFADITTKKMVIDEATSGDQRFLIKGELTVYDNAELRNDRELKRRLLTGFGRNVVNEFEDEIAIDLDDGALSIQKNGGFWVRVFYWNGGDVREEDRFIAAR